MLDFESVALTVLSEALLKKGESLREEKLKNMREAIQENKSVLSPIYAIEPSAAMRAVYSLTYFDKLRKTEFRASLETAEEVYKILHEGYKKTFPENMLSSAKEAAAKVKKSDWMADFRIKKMSDDDVMCENKWFCFSVKNR